ncbi:IclR family transcriptional regulator [Sphingomonas nostoxanthinifaciens]|uniref:IclR family transcriptional regulator n=1 Tax=Sphingomonas nostoxanthinifaciens TaxID=2872652 RepID=UPI001CC21CAF|nr:IclR family transcriptional regulator [Sphingomonas nostoxanthinifaciens]UAK25031.1 IclR family transcriptional regulator [Sphingomonas nostoxanthinifaciens]
MSTPPSDATSASVGAGSQTLMRGLDVIEAVSEGSLSLAELAQRLDLAKSTAHRLASALVDRGYLGFTPRAGYRLGPKLLALGHLAHAQTDLIQVARDHLERLAASSEDTVHLGILDGDQALYLDKVAGRRRITISSRVGDRHPLSSTGLGKALMLDHPVDYWLDRLAREQETSTHRIAADLWRERMDGYVVAGRAFDLEENEDQIRCVAAPLRDASGKIVGAISVSSAAQYMDDARMDALSHDVVTTARAISRDLGWTDKGK